MSEVIPGDEDRGGDGALEPEPETDVDTAEEQQGGDGADDGGPGSLNM